MADFPSQSPPPLRPKVSRRQHRGPRLWPWLLLSVVMYAIAGLLLSAFSSPYWVWPIALVSTLLQALALAGPQALQGLTRWRAGWAILVGCLGSGGLVVALAIAVGYAGTDDIDAMQIGATAVEVFLVNLGVLLLTATCTIIGARTGDQLLNLFNRTRSILLLASVCFLGLFLGGLVGLTLAA
jgi:hypothetical protein